MHWINVALIRVYKMKFDCVWYIWFPHRQCLTTLIKKEIKFQSEESGIFVNRIYNIKINMDISNWIKESNVIK